MAVPVEKCSQKPTSQMCENDFSNGLQEKKRKKKKKKKIPQAN